MISEIITFKLRPGMTRAEVVATYRKTSSIWRSNPDCIRKCYLYDGERGLGGGAYLWKSIDAAKLAHGDAWRTMINDLYGSEDQISMSPLLAPPPPVPLHAAKASIATATSAPTLVFFMNSPPGRSDRPDPPGDRRSGTPDPTPEPEMRQPPSTLAVRDPRRRCPPRASARRGEVRDGRRCRTVLGRRAGDRRNDAVS